MKKYIPILCLLIFVAAGPVTYDSISSTGTPSSTTYLRGDGSWSTPVAGTGTVTSVAATVPTFLSISGSPITTSGTLALTLSGTALPVANGGTGITSFGTGVATAFGNNTLVANGLLTLDGSGFVPALTHNNITFTGTTGIVGGATATVPAVGNVGNTQTNLVAVGSPVSLSTTVAANVVSKAVNAGHYLVFFQANVALGSATMVAASPMQAGISSTSATLPTDGSEAYMPFTVTLGSTNLGIPITGKYINLTSNGTIYGVEKATFSAGTVSGFGALTIISLP